MHDCSQCGQACYCDLDDCDMGEAPADCDHVCEETNDDEQFEGDGDGKA